MPHSTISTPLNDYNIYKIPHGLSNEFKEFLETKQFEEIPLFDSMFANTYGFTFSLLFCDKDNRNGSAWMRLLSEFTNPEYNLERELKVYGAVLLCINETSCFAVSFGNAHFYMNAYCEYSFGISVAEHLINLDTVQSQQNLSHGSRINRTYMDFYGSTPITYRSGEIPTFVKGSSLNKELWGDTISCGVSAQFRWKERPYEICEKLSLLDQALGESPNFHLPQLVELDSDHDSDKISDLFLSLANSISQYDESELNTRFLSFPSFYMSGTSIVQNNPICYKISCNRKVKIVNGDLTISTIKDFLVSLDQSLDESIRKTNISIDSGNGFSPYKPLIRYFEYVTNNFCLNNGKWCYFNNSYLDRILKEARTIQYSNHISDELRFDRQFLVEYAKEKEIYVASERQPYETYYNFHLSEILNAHLVHPDQSYADQNISRRLKYEICDVYVDGILYFVKIGSVSDFAYAFDQAMITLENIESSHNTLCLPDGTEIYANAFRFVFILTNRANAINGWNEVFSLNYLLHMNEMKRRLSLNSIKLEIELVYEN